MVGEQTSNFFLDFWPSGGPSRPWEYFAGTRIGILHPYMVSNLDLKPWQASGGSFTRNMVPSIGTSDPWLGLLGLPCLGLAWLASQPGSSLPTATTTRPPSAGGAALRAAVVAAVAAGGARTSQAEKQARPGQGKQSKPSKQCCNHLVQG